MPADDDDVVDDDDVAEITTSWQGTVTAPDGSPIAGLNMALCGIQCLNDISDEAGVFRIDHPPLGPVVLKNLSAPGLETTGWSRAFDIVTVVEDVHHIAQEPVVVPRLESPAPEVSGPQDIVVDGGLRLVFDADVLEAESGDHPIAVSGIELPPEQWPTGGLSDWTILRGWALAVWDLHQVDAIAAEAPLREAVPEGAEVAFLVADYDHGRAAGAFAIEDAELSEDRLTLLTPAEAGLDRLTLVFAAMR